MTVCHFPNKIINTSSLEAKTLILKINTWSLSEPEHRGPLHPALGYMLLCPSVLVSAQPGLAAIRFLFSSNRNRLGESVSHWAPFFFSSSLSAPSIYSSFTAAVQLSTVCSIKHRPLPTTSPGMPLQPPPAAARTSARRPSESSGREETHNDTHTDGLAHGLGHALVDKDTETHSETSHMDAQSQTRTHLQSQI